MHLTYRSWCRHCVRGRGRNKPHKVGKDGEVEEELGVRRELVEKILSHRSAASIHWAQLRHAMHAVHNLNKIAGAFRSDRHRHDAPRG